MKIFKTFMKEIFKRHKSKHISYLLTGMKTDTQINRAEQQSQKETHPYIVSQLMKKEPRISGGERTSFSKIALGKMDSAMKKQKCTPVFNHTQKSTKKGLKS